MSGIGSRNGYDDFMNQYYSTMVEFDDLVEELEVQYELGIEREVLLDDVVDNEVGDGLVRFHDQVFLIGNEDMWVEGDPPPLSQPLINYDDESVTLGSQDTVDVFPMRGSDSDTDSDYETDVETWTDPYVTPSRNRSRLVGHLNRTPQLN